MAAKKPAATWFILVSGGEKRAEQEAVTRKEFKKIYSTILEQKLVDKDHIVFFSGGQGTRRLDPELKHTYAGHGADRFSASLSQKAPPTHSYWGYSEEEGWYSGARVDISDVDNAVVIFIGHGNEPESWSLMPPSATSPELTQDDLLGALVFFHDDKKSLYRPAISGLPKSKYTLFISLACYSGNTFQKAMTVDPWRKSANLEKQKKLSSQMMAVCLADPDHPASYDPILGQAFADFFKTDQQGKDKTIIQFCNYLQEKYQTHPYLLEMKKENLEQTEEDYELERKDAAEWAVKEFAGYLPRAIPHDLWRVFQEVEHLKKTIEEAKPEDISQEASSKLSDHIAKLEDMRFDLMRMYKRKPNNKLCVCGATDAIGKMTWREFLHLPEDTQ